MNKNQIGFADYNIFLIKMLIWLGFAALGFLMALGGFFYAPIAWGALVIALIFFARFVFQKNIFSFVSREFWIAGLSLFVLALVFSFFSTPSVFSGRDQGSIAEAAIRLSQNHKLAFSTPESDAFFPLRGPGLALNFPGFYYQKNGSLITQFPITYISWLALFFSLFGVWGLTFANTILFAIFLVSFYLLLRLFVSPKFAALGILFVITSFGIFWFTKLTLSENMALPLVWLAALSLILFWREHTDLSLTILLSSLCLLCFARIEGFALLAIIIILLFSNKSVRQFIQEKKSKRFYLPLLVMIILTILDIWINFPFFKEIAKALFPTITPPGAELLGTMQNVSLPFLYFPRVYAIYGMLGFFFFAAIGIIFIFKKGFSEKVLPFILIAPTLLYLYDSHISADQPWMLRRFMFSILPGAIFYTTLLFSDLRFQLRKYAATIPIIYIASLGLLAMNMPAFLNYATYCENKGLLDQLGNLSQNFEAGSLVLVDQQATGDGWNMLDEPLSSLKGVQAAYFFNTQDLSKLNLDNFGKVYLVVPKEDSAYYLNSTIGGRLTLQNNFTFNINKLSGTSSDPFRKAALPEKTRTDMEVSIFQISK